VSVLSVVHLLLASGLVVWLACGSAQAQTASAPATTQSAPKVDPDQLPISLDRIQGRLEKTPALNLHLMRPVFRAEVVQKRSDWFRDIDWLGSDVRLPPATAPQWHNEFLNMVTPPEARPYSQALTQNELLQITATSIVQALVTQSLVPKVKAAAQRRREAEARREVDDAIASWKLEHEAPATADTPP
jgi:hypothetical protein